MSYSPFIIANPYFTWTLRTHLPNKCIVSVDTRLPNSISTLLFSAQALEPRSATLVLIRQQAIDRLPSSLDIWQAAISWTYQVVDNIIRVRKQWGWVNMEETDYHYKQINCILNLLFMPIIKYLSKSFFNADIDFTGFWHFNVFDTIHHCDTEIAYYYFNTTKIRVWNNNVYLLFVVNQINHIHVCLFSFSTPVTVYAFLGTFTFSTYK